MFNEQSNSMSILKSMASPYIHPIREIKADFERIDKRYNTSVDRVVHKSGVIFTYVLILGAASYLGSYSGYYLFDKLF